MNENLLDEQISELCRERNALILAHCYTNYAVQAVSHKVGDSLELARYAMSTDKDIIVFCGVKFMGESAKLLCPDKTVLMPVANAFCPMADSVTDQDIENLRKEYPEAAFVCYINSTAKTKALCDICCTSANAVKVIKSLPQNQIVFLPDKNLGSYVKEKIPDKEIILFDGCCPCHNNASEEDVKSAKQKHPDALFLVHPECQSLIRSSADFVGSSSQIISFAEKSENNEFIIGTENGLTDRLSRIFPQNKFYPLSLNFVCEDMKKITKQDVLDALLYETNEVLIDESVASRASIPLAKMMDL